MGLVNTKPSNNYIFDLPTGAEWEYACRAGTTGSYSGDLDAMAWYSKNCELQTHEVGLKNANEWRVHDMHGNVWEWCSDWKVNYTEATVTDPQEANTGSFRVMRGGSWLSNSIGCRSANVHGYVSDARARYLGFRLVLRQRP